MKNLFVALAECANDKNSMAGGGSVLYNKFICDECGKPKQDQKSTVCIICRCKIKKMRKAKEVLKNLCREKITEERLVMYCRAILQILENSK